MNVPCSLAPISRFRRAGAVRLAALLFLSGLTGCFSPEPKAVLPSLADSFTELKKTVVELRGLPLKRDITQEIVTPKGSQVAPDQALTEQYGSAPLAVIERVYKSIGLLPLNSDLGKALAEYYRLEQLVAYNGVKGSIVTAPEAAQLGAAFATTNPRAALEAPVIFGIAQALQEQHFNWQERTRSILPEDRRQAFRAVASGDATLTALMHFSGNKTALRSAAEIETLSRFGAEIERLSFGLPDLLRHQLLFRYREGTEFVIWAYAAKGWQGVNGLFENPPLTTAQIIHPEKFFVRQEKPLRLFPWGLIRRMNYSAVVEQTIGESSLRGLLEAALGRKEAMAIASAWRGDQLLAFAEAGNLITAWISSWASDQDAGQFHRVYQTVLERQQRVRFASVASGKNDTAMAETANGRSLLLQVKGSTVVLLTGLAPNTSLEVANDTWRDLEIDAESMIYPFDSARGPLQLSRTSR